MIKLPSILNITTVGATIISCSLTVVIGIGIVGIGMVGIGAVGLAASGTVRAEDNPAGEAAERCITIRSIKQTKILDDQTVIFYTNNNRNYKNRFPHPCNGLASADSFMYRTSESKLCNVDMITVLNKFGSAFTQGPSCGLGLFEPVDKVELDALTKKPQ